MFNITESTAIQRAMNLRNAKKGFQVSVQWAVEQALSGNANGLYQIVMAAGMLENVEGEPVRRADYRQLMAYLRAPIADGGCGFSHIVRWDKGSKRFKMCEKWMVAAQSMDYASLVVNLRTHLWYVHANEKKDAPKVELSKSIERFLARMSKAGFTEAQVREALVAQSSGEMVLMDARRGNPVEVSAVVH